MKMCEYHGVAQKLLYPCERLEIESVEWRPLERYMVVLIKDKATGEEGLYRFDDYGAEQLGHPKYGWRGKFAVLWLCIIPPHSIHEFVILPLDFIKDKERGYRVRSYFRSPHDLRWMPKALKERIRNGEVPLDELIDEIRKLDRWKKYDEWC